MNILIPNYMTEESVRHLSQFHQVVYDVGMFGRPDDLMAHLPHADAIIVRNELQVRGEVLDALAKCRVVGRLGVGLDNIDLAGCKERGKLVIPAIGQNALAVAEYVVTTAMVLLRGIYFSSDRIARGEWPRAAFGRGNEISGKTLGIVGYGSIGQRTGKLAAAVGMNVIACDGGRDNASADVPLCGLDELLERSDVVSLHIPLTEQTRGLLNRERLQRMKPGSVLINVARGGIVDESALVEALHSGHLKGAALDVFEPEPVAPDSVLIGAKNLILTPHVGGVTFEAENRVCDFIAKAVVQALAS